MNNQGRHPPGALLVPALERMWTKSATAIMQLAFRLPAGSCHWIDPRRRGIPKKRNEMTRRFLARDDLRWSLWCDDDMVPPPDAALRLLEHGKDIVAGVFCTREDGSGLVLASRVTEGEPSGDPLRPFQSESLRVTSLSLEELASGELLQVDVTGFGFILVRRRVFEALEDPWFVDNRRTEEKPEGCEDLNFLWRAKEAGFDVHVDTSLPVGHLGLVNVTPRKLIEQAAIQRRDRQVVREGA